MWRIATVLAFLAAGCAHQPAAQRPGVTGSALDRAYDQVRSGAQASAHGDGYVVERSSDSSVRVVREAPTGGLGSDVSDASLTNKVKGKLTSTREIQVSTKAGAVTLSGNAPSRDAAMKAIRDTLSLDGVTAVKSQLEWPGQMRAGAPPTRF